MLKYAYMMTRSSLPEVSVQIFLLCFSSRLAHPTFRMIPLHHFIIPCSIYLLLSNVFTIQQDIQTLSIHTTNKWELLK